MNGYSSGSCERAIPASSTPCESYAGTPAGLWAGTNRIQAQYMRVSNRYTKRAHAREQAMKAQQYLTPPSHTSASQVRRISTSRDTLLWSNCMLATYTAHFSRFLIGEFLHIWKAPKEVEAHKSALHTWLGRTKK